MKTIIRIYNSTTSMMESILCGLGSSLWPYLTIIFLNWLVHTKPSDRDECPQNRDICQLLCFCLSPEATTCKTAMNLQVENVKDLKTEHKLLEASPYRLWNLDWWCVSLERIKKAHWVDIHQSLVYVWLHIHIYANSKYIYTHLVSVIYIDFS